MPNSYYIRRGQLSRLRAAARKAGIHELCYLAVGRGSRISRLISVPNRAEETVLHHQFDGEDVKPIFARKSLTNQHLLGLLHTHPLSGAFPSDDDLGGYEPGNLMLIYSDQTQELRAFRLSKEPPGYVEKAVIVE